jgi:hypothetical protein
MLGLRDFVLASACLAAKAPGPELLIGCIDLVRISGSPESRKNVLYIFFLGTGIMKPATLSDKGKERSVPPTLLSPMQQETKRQRQKRF